MKVALAAAFAAGTLMVPAQALEAARNAMEVWFYSVAPALFPFAAVMPYLTSPQARHVYDKLLGGAVRRLFRLPGRCASAVVTGMLAGSPAGALATARVAAAEGLSRGQAARLAGIACGVGPVYIISGIGAALLDSARVGWQLAISQWLALVITGMLFSRAWAGEPPTETQAPSAGEERPVQAAVMAVLKVCGYMLLFSVGIAVLGEMLGRELGLVGLVADLPSGAAALAQRAVAWREPALAVGVGLGGLCIAAQNMSVLGTVGVTWGKYLAQKLTTGIVSGLVFVALTEIDIGGVALGIDGREYEVALLALALLMIPVLMGFLRKRNAKC